MVESLMDLDGQLERHGSRLRFYYDDEHKVLSQLIRALKPAALAFNMDYTQYSQQRDNVIQQLADTHKVPLIRHHDYVLFEPGVIVTGSGTTYKKFTPFYNAALETPVAKPSKTFVSRFWPKSKSMPSAAPAEFNGDLQTMHDMQRNPNLPERGGRASGLAILKKMATWKTYDANRDQLIYKTTHLSPFNKFGCVSIREVYWVIRSTLGLRSDLLRQLIWRDFFYHLSNTHPYIFSAGPLDPKWNAIPWKNEESKWRAWCQGRTGYPVVDACMAEINTTGYMHNRGRLIVANFLTRLLHIDWRWGERYFAQHLYDYDPVQNSFGWQINAAVTGTESRPLNQTILNPWIQSAKYDPDAEYIKTWLPELKDIPARDLHAWDVKHVKYPDVAYPAPIIDYAKEREVNLALYNSV